MIDTKSYAQKMHNLLNDKAKYNMRKNDIQRKKNTVIQYWKKTTRYIKLNTI